MVDFDCRLPLEFSLLRLNLLGGDVSKGQLKSELYLSL